MLSLSKHLYRFAHAKPHPQPLSKREGSLTISNQTFSVPPLRGRGAVPGRGQGVRLTCERSSRDASGALTVTYRDEHWQPQRWAVQGAVSELLQHECDHLDGVLCTMRALDAQSFRWRP